MLAARAHGLMGPCTAVSCSPGLLNVLLPLPRMPFPPPVLSPSFPGSCCHLLSETFLDFLPRPELEVRSVYLHSPRCLCVMYKQLLVRDRSYSST